MFLCTSTHTRTHTHARSLPEGSFKLVHYAGEVVYTVNGFLEKNTDTLFKDLGRLAFASKNPILREMFPEVCTCKHTLLQHTHTHVLHHSHTHTHTHVFCM
jgi:myosin heavy subunit